MKQRIPNFDSFLHESVQWEGKVSPISKELWDLCTKVLPENILSNVDYVENTGESAGPVPSNIKGNTTGTVGYNGIAIVFKKPIGTQQVTSLGVHIRKRTSGPGTGYFMIDGTSKGYRVLMHDKPNHAISAEFYVDTPLELFKKMWKESVYSYFI